MTSIPYAKSACAVAAVVLSSIALCEAFTLPTPRRSIQRAELTSTNAVTRNRLDDYFNDICDGFIRPTLFAAALAASIFSSQPAFADGTPNEDVAQPTTSSKLNGPPAYDEAWGLIKKYALDQKYNGQDWDEAYAKYMKDVSQIMKATSNLVGSLGDKYSRVLDKDMYTRIQKFDLIGVGCTLMPDPTTKEIIVGAPPVQDSAAFQAGLKVGDAVLAVNGVDTMGRTAFDIIDQISESPDASKVTFTIRSGGEYRDVTMKRELLDVKDPVSYRVSETRADGTKVGYVRVSEGNPGGAFQSAVEIAGLFMSDKLATDVVDGNGVALKFRTSKNKVAIDPSDPIAIWVDGRSASASEVLSGALRDNCRAVVMGDQSFGKGLVQAVYGLKNGYGLVLTVAKYLTPNGTDINKVGIVPDVSKEDALPSSPGFVPFFGSDTSRVDFNDVKTRMSSPMCSSIE
ncbi:carboxyl-terminal processing protease [Skeletonema marinoi]|uniref:Carboxyl-terminal processing protease n=1 Tax=Skeletonema marinoi TaxID=267567 RepID=A0AAD9DF55_9STRA|nr:carboxyl-terminal processing protease [Skeletonema marinoi]